MNRAWGKGYRNSRRASKIRYVSSVYSKCKKGFRLIKEAEVQAKEEVIACNNYWNMYAINLYVYTQQIKFFISYWYLKD